VLDHKGKTGCIDVLFNGIDSSNLRLNNYLNGETTTTPNGNAETNPINTTPTLINGNNSSTTQANSRNDEHEAVGGATASSTTSSNLDGENAAASGATSAIDDASSMANTLANLSIGLPQG
jgi:hypothetical protein